MAKTDKTKFKKKTSSSAKKKVDECLFNHLDVPAETALYYGFTIVDTPQIKKDDIKKARSLNDSEMVNKDAPDAPTKTSAEERVALLRLYTEKNFQNMPQPVMLYMGKQIIPEGSPRKTSSKERSISLEIMGTSKSIAEAILIKTAFEILREEADQIVPSNV